MFLLRPVMATLLCLICFSCKQEDKPGIASTPMAEISLEDQVNKEVKTAFESVLYNYVQRNAIQLNECSFYADNRSNSKKCKSMDCQKKKAVLKKHSLSDLVSVDYDPDQLTIDVFSDFAIVNFKANLYVRQETDPVITCASGTMEFVKDNGKWKLSHEHLIAAGYR